MGTNKQMDELLDVATEKGHVIYSIHFCLAGVGIQWHDRSRYVSEFRPRDIAGINVPEEVNWKEGLYIEAYYDDLGACFEGERKRLLEMTEKVSDDAKP